MPMNSFTLPVPPENIVLIGGGDLMPVPEYQDGERVGERTRNNKVLKRCPGLVAQVGGETMDGFVVQTTADADEIPEGSILSVSGESEVTVRGNAHAGFGDSGPRATLGGVVFVEAIEPVGSLADLLRQAQTRRGRKTDGE